MHTSRRGFFLPSSDILCSAEHQLVDFAARVQARFRVFLLLLSSQFAVLCSDWLNHGLLATSTNQLNAELRGTKTERQEIAHCAVIKMNESVV